ncbi:putative serine/threonine protein kinase [Blattamonas nauphoetae]|uniref:Serine/threonine protein kinase n=1 Tax=Blattamonas nauphoetae TaxID=2049346 RepID=A0ABQ9Y662_9EUKA|nr:putative serine/threonine protein kinase [Blattamonas nauphoetae]
MDPVRFSPLTEYTLMERLYEGEGNILIKGKKATHSTDLVIRMTPKDPELNIERFDKIIKSTRHLNEPFVLQFVDSQRDDSAIYIVREHTAAPNLRKYLKSHPSNKEASAWDLVTTLTQSLFYIHAMGVIHCHLIMENIFIPQKHLAQISDASIHQILPLQKELDLQDMAYRAPELFDESIHYTTKVDMYALGAILYEICTGRPPFQANNPKELIEIIRNDDPKDLPTSFSSDLKNLVFSLLNKDPLKRPNCEHILALQQVKPKADKFGEMIYEDAISKKERQRSLYTDLERDLAKRKALLDSYRDAGKQAVQGNSDSSFVQLGEAWKDLDKSIEEKQAKLPILSPGEATVVWTTDGRSSTLYQLKEVPRLGLSYNILPLIPPHARLRIEGNRICLLQEEPLLLPFSPDIDNGVWRFDLGFVACGRQRWIGIADSSFDLPRGYDPGEDEHTVGYAGYTGGVWHNGNWTLGNRTFTEGEVIGCEVNMTKKPRTCTFFHSLRGQPVTVLEIPPKIRFFTYLGGKGATVEILNLRTTDHLPPLRPDPQAKKVTWGQ